MSPVDREPVQPAITIPEYLPGPLVAYIRAQEAGWKDTIERGRERLALLEHLGQGGTERAARERTEITAREEQALGDWRCLQRLVERSEMGRVYRDLLAAPPQCPEPGTYEAKILVVEEVSDQELRIQRLVHFIDAAWRTRFDYDALRREAAEGKEVLDAIAGAAGELSRHLRRLASLGIDHPRELYSLPDLLLAVDPDPHDRHLWLEARRSILAHAENDEETGARLRQVKEAAPPVAALLDAIAAVASATKAQPEEAWAAAAVASRKKAVKAAYIRALGEVLARTHGLPPPGYIVRAMADATAVVLDDPELEVTTDDVYSALRALKRR